MLHGDISLGNILLVDDPQDGSFVGFIHDFDYSSMTKAPPTDEDRQNGMLGRKDEHDAIGEEVTVSVVLSLVHLVSSQFLPISGHILLPPSGLSLRG